VVEELEDLDGFPRRYLGVVSTCLGWGGYRVGWSGRGCGGLLSRLFGWRGRGSRRGSLPLGDASCALFRGMGYRVGDPGREGMERWREGAVG
jgi:hypothetical protein